MKAGLRHFLTLGAALTVVASAAGQPSPNQPLPQTPKTTARALVDTTDSLRKAIDAWRASTSAAVPNDVTLYALYEQRLYRLLSDNAPRARATFQRLPRPLAAYARDVVVAHRELVRLTPPLRTRMVHVGPAAPAADLLRWYHEAERRFGVAWRVLAAVNFVESAFGKLRSASAAGAQGPMQFTRSSWRKYGLGGNVHDPHDAILGAANYLRAAGARRNIRRALYAYNPSQLYVDAVLRYARRIGADIHAYYSFYSWQVFVRTTSGVRRVTGPGLP
ncbi:MAG: lytic transglycosylase domain-containing protein [Gaiellaceae bacterium]